VADRHQLGDPTHGLRLQQDDRVAPTPCGDIIPVARTWDLSPGRATPGDPLL
jgi:hypothetical protein